jgi:nitrate reductase gamma subunit
MEEWLAFARGPAFRFAIAILILGVLRHLVVTVLSVRTIMSRAGDKALPWKAIRASTLGWLFPVRHLGQSRIFTASSIAFHAGVLLAPLFLAGHVLLVDRTIGISWPTLPNLLADILTVLAIVGLTAVAVVRMSSKDGRALSRPSDYAILVLTALPFLSGFLTMHPGLNPFPFEFTLLLHVLSGSLLLALVPFTKLVHVVVLPATQLVSEAGWHFPPDAGEKVAAALGKENQPV